MNHDTRYMILSSRAKAIEKKYWEKTNIDIINWEKLFDRSTDHR